MASPEMSFNAYEIYKSNINKILQWLLTTARASKAADDFLQQISKTQSTKKIAKANNTKSSKDNTAVKITIQNLQELAKAVTDVKTLKVPEEIITGAKDATSFLLVSHAWFLAHGQEGGTVKHPTNEQKKILDKIDQNIAKVKQLSQAMKNLSELLSRPHEDESSEINEAETELSELTTAATNLTLGPSSDESALHYELDAPTQHEALALYSFLKDCTNVQLFVARTWQEFKDGTIGLLSASLVTNVGTAMLQEWSDELRATLPRLRNPNTRNIHKILKDVVNAEYCYCDNILPQPSLGEVADEVVFEDVSIVTALSGCTHKDVTKTFVFKRGKGRYCPNGYEEQDDMFFRCISQLGGLQYFDTNLQERLNVMRQKNDVELAEEVKAIKKSDSENGTLIDLALVRLRYEEDFADQRRHAEDDEETYKQRFWRCDYMYKACSSFLTGQKDSWIIYAAQILRDTQRRLEEDASEGLDMLQDQAYGLTKQYEVYLADTDIDHSGKKQKRWKQDIEDQVNFLHKAITQSDFQNLANKLEAKRVSDTEEDAQFSLLGNHPMLCGILLNETRNKCQEISIDVASEQGHILAVAHLYNAAWQSGYLEKSATWVDMEWFIKRQGSEWIFGGKRPKLPSDCVEAICVALGLDRSTFKQDRVEASESRGAVRRLHFLTRYLEPDVKREIDGAGKVVGETRTSHDMLAKMRAMASEYDGSTASTETLTSFRLALEQDEVAFNFNVLGLHMKCLRLLRQIRDVCLERAPKDYPADIYDKPANLNLIAVELLRDLNGCERRNKRMVLRATGLMSDLIEPDGEQGFKQATRLTEFMRISQDDGGDEDDEDDEDYEDDEDRESSSDESSAESDGSGYEPRSDESDAESED